VTTFFQIAEAAGIGRYVIGRRGSPTRLVFSAERLSHLFGEAQTVVEAQPKVEATEEPVESTTEVAERTTHGRDDSPEIRSSEREGIFIAHGKNKKPLDQLKLILDQFKIPYKVAVDEPNLGRPISTKVKETMESCNCAILLFTADEELKDKDGNTIWRPSENVVFELGAASLLYDNRLVIMRENMVVFPSNYRDVGNISFEKDLLEAKTMDILKELIGFGIVKIST
jgi:predicted nucleotide-binding protein